MAEGHETGARESQRGCFGHEGNKRQMDTEVTGTLFVGKKGRGHPRGSRPFLLEGAKDIRL